MTKQYIVAATKSINILQNGLHKMGIGCGVMKQF